MQARTAYIHALTCVQPDFITQTSCQCKLQHTHTLKHRQARADSGQVHTYHSPASKSALHFSLKLGAKIRTGELKIHYSSGGGGASWEEGSGEKKQQKKEVSWEDMDEGKKDLIKDRERKRWRGASLDFHTLITHCTNHSVAMSYAIMLKPVQKISCK